MTKSRERIWPRGPATKTRTSLLRRLLLILLILAALSISISVAAFLYWQRTASYSLVRATYTLITQDQAGFYKYVDLKSILRFAMEDFKAIAAESSHTQITNATSEELAAIQRFASSPEEISHEIEARLNNYFHAPPTPGKTFEIPVLGKVEGKYIVPFAVAGVLAITSEKIYFTEISDRVTRMSIEHYIERVDRNLVFDIEFEKRPDSPWVMTRWSSLESNLRALLFSPQRVEGKTRTHRIQWKGQPISFGPFLSFLKALFMVLILLAFLKRLRIYRIDPNQTKPPHYQVGLAFRNKEYLCDVKSGNRNHPHTVQPVKAARASPDFIPAGIRMTQSLNKIEIVREWRSLNAWIYLFISGFFFMQITMFTLMAPILSLVVFPIHIITAVLLYRTAALFLNRTTIEVSSQSVKVRHHPMPWPGQKTIESGNIRQVYSFEKNQESRHEPNYKYTVNAILKDGRTIQLVAAGVDQEQALFIAEIIQKRLLLKPHLAVAE